MTPSTLSKYSYDHLLDAVEVEMRRRGCLELAATSVFTPGLYTRSVVVPENVYMLSHEHATEHQFILSCGQAIVYTKDRGMVLLSAPYLNITEKGTRRLVKSVTPIVWTSIHATDISPADGSQEAFDEAVRLVEAELFAKRENIFLIQSMEELPCQE